MRTARKRLGEAGHDSGELRDRDGMAKKAVEVRALPVGQGDAFLARCRGFTALIDGGRSRRRLPLLLPKVVRAHGVDVLVCTHNDADHADGVWGFLEAGLPCEEVWLPGTWTSRLDDLLLRPREFAEELVRDIDSVPDEAAVTLETIALGEASRPEGGRREGNPDEARRFIGELLDLASWIDRFIVWPPWRAIPRPRMPLLIEALAAGERIRRIAMAAHAAGVPIRWLEYGDGHHRAGPLTCINAHELVAMPGGMSALVYLSLTVQNKQSLVCTLTPDGAPAALFTADSDLTFRNPVPWSRGMLITAPHHGSDANAAAYQRAAREHKGPALWVRSDGWYKSRPGSHYTKQEVRYCTRCRRTRTVQEIVVVARGQQWEAPGISPCSCAGHVTVDDKRVRQLAEQLERRALPTTPTESGPSAAERFRIKWGG